MKENAAVHGFAHKTNARFSLVLLAALAALLACLGSTALAAPVGKDGQIHACYRVKGKPKGALRVVRSARAHCRRGERKVAWSVVPSSQGGQGGSTGRQGDAGVNGSSGTPTEAALQAKVAGLTLKVEALENLLAGVGKGDLGGISSRVNGLEGVLDGVDNEGLTHAVGAVEDVTGSELLEAVNAVPLVGEVCNQTEALTAVTNEFGPEFQKLMTTLSGTLLGAIFGGVKAPGTVTETLSCPAP